MRYKGIAMKSVRQPNARVPLSTIGCKVDGSLAVLFMLRSMVGVGNIADLQRIENRLLVRNAITLLPANSFTLKQLSIAADYLTGESVTLVSKEQFQPTLLRELK